MERLFSAGNKHKLNYKIHTCEILLLRALRPMNYIGGKLQCETRNSNCIGSTIVTESVERREIAMVVVFVVKNRGFCC